MCTTLLTYNQNETNDFTTFSLKLLTDSKSHSAEVPGPGNVQFLFLIAGLRSLAFHDPPADRAPYIWRKYGLYPLSGVGIAKGDFVIEERAFHIPAQLLRAAALMTSFIASTFL